MGALVLACYCNGQIALGEMRAQLGASDVQRLVKGAACRVETIREDVNRHPFQCQRNEYTPLVRGQQLAVCLGVDGDPLGSSALAARQACPACAVISSPKSATGARPGPGSSERQRLLATPASASCF